MEKAIIHILPFKKCKHGMNIRPNWLKQTKTDIIKFIYSEKATKSFRNLHLFLTGTSISQKKVEISQNFCGLLRIYEL